MSTLVGIVGPTGSGKTASVESLPPEKTFFINIDAKPLSFKGWKKRYTPFTTDTPEGLKGNYYIPSQEYQGTQASGKTSQLLQFISDNRPEIKYIVVDDYQYLLSNEYMHRSGEKSYDKFVDIAFHAWQPLQTGARLRDDLIVFILTHDEEYEANAETKRRIKAIGKMIHKDITLEGKFTIVLFTEFIRDGSTPAEKYRFMTQTNGFTTAKSPAGMFDDLLIPNDLNYVAQRIEQYNAGE